MDRLPQELIDLILSYNISAIYLQRVQHFGNSYVNIGVKRYGNGIIKLRSVCRRFRDAWPVRSAWNEYVQEEDRWAKRAAGLSAFRDFPRLRMPLARWLEHERETEKLGRGNEGGLLAVTRHLRKKYW